MCSIGLLATLYQGLVQTKGCHTEQQRQEHGIGCAFIAPARDSGMIRRIGERLKLHWGARNACIACGAVTPMELVQPQEDLDTTNREKYSEYFLFNHGTL